MLLVPKLMFSGSTNPIKYNSTTLVHDLIFLLISKSTNSHEKLTKSEIKLVQILLKITNSVLFDL